MRKQPFEIRVNDVPLSLIGGWGRPVVKYRWPGGCWELRWEMTLRRQERPPALQRGAIVRAYAGSAPVWYGRLAAPDWREGVFVAEGAARDLEAAIALQIPGLTLDPGVALYYAAARGTANIGGLENFTPVTDAEPSQYNSIAALLDAWCDERSLRWAVNEIPLIYTNPDPTTPTWHILPGLEGPTATVESQVTHLYATYRNSVTYAKAFVNTGTTGASPRIERAIDLTPRGRMTEAKARSIIEGILAKAGSLARLSSAIEVTQGQVVDRLGQEVGLARLRAGRMVRQHGVRDPRTGTTWADVVVGESEWRVEEKVVALSPVEAVLPDFSSVVEQAGGTVVI